MPLNDIAALATILTLILYVIVEHDKIIQGIGISQPTAAQTNSSVAQQTTKEGIRQILRWAIAGVAILNAPIVIPLIFLYIEGGSTVNFSVRGLLAFVYAGAVVGVIARLVFVTVKKALQISAKGKICWGKSGNLWWLCRDLYAILSRLNDPSATKREIDHYLLKCHHHAVKATFDGDIVSRLEKLKEEARNFSQSDWTSEKRRDYTQALGSILNDIGRIAEQKQLDFDPGPSLI